MPLVDNYGNVNVTTKRKILVPANGSKWNSLVGSNPLKAEGYIELREGYLHPRTFVGQFTPGEKLLEFLGSHVAVLDIPYLCPPNAAIPAVCSPLTKENTFLLLDWIRYIKNRRTAIPERQLKGTSYNFPSDLKNCILKVKWLRTRFGDFRSPKECILFGPEWESISSITHLPVIDDSDNYYGTDIRNSITPRIALSLLKCLRILLEDKNYNLSEEFLSEVSKNWLKTYVGYMSPVDCLLFDERSGLKPTYGLFGLHSI
ncbi:hypothetical protein V6N11_078395 [Hibiscus sabdariffa]